MRNSKMKMVLGALLVFFCSIVALGQTITGDIGGTISDASGAVVPGGKVTATNVATNVSTSVITNKDGIYSIRFLQVGTYKVTVSSKSFSTQVTAPFLLEASQVARVDTKLVAGAETTVEVIAEATPILNTENGMISTTISETLINDLPVNGHNTTELTQVMPGSTVADGNQWNGATGSPNNSGERVQSLATLPNINGNRAYSTNFTLDGISIADTGANITNGFDVPAYNIPPEALQEVTVLSVVPPAEYGDGATQILSIMKDGTSKYHGSLGAWLQNWEMDANTFGNKRVLPGSAFTPRTHYTQANYNATASGPVPFLHKLFFFADYEAYRKPSAGQSRISVPLNAWRGNTTSNDASDSSVSPLAGYAYFGSSVPQLYDSQNSFAPFNQTINGVTYQNLVPIRNPVAKYIFAHPNLLPLPNEAASGSIIQNNYAANTKSLTRNDQADLKLDWTPTDKDKFTIRWSQGEADDYPSQEITPVSFQGDNDFPFLQSALNYTRVITPSIVNEFRAGYTRIAYKSFNLDLSGLFGSGESTVGIPWPNAVSGFSAQAYTESTTSGSASTIGTAATGNVAIDNQFSYGDDLTWQHGRHISKFGAGNLQLQRSLHG